MFSLTPLYLDKNNTYNIDVTEEVELYNKRQKTKKSSFKGIFNSFNFMHTDVGQYINILDVFRTELFKAVNTGISAYHRVQHIDGGTYEFEPSSTVNMTGVSVSSLVDEMYKGYAILPSIIKSRLGLAETINRVVITNTRLQDFILRDILHGKRREAHDVMASIHEFYTVFGMFKYARNPQVSIDKQGDVNLVYYNGIDLWGEPFVEQGKIGVDTF